MEQNDSSGMNPSKKFRESFFFGGLVILIPVYVSKAPEETFVTEFFCHLKVGFTVFSLMRPIVFGHILSGYVFIGSFYIFQFFLEIFYRRNMGHVGVMPTPSRSTQTSSSAPMVLARPVGMLSLYPPSRNLTPSICRARRAGKQAAEAIR